MSNNKRPATKQRPWEQGAETAGALSFGSWLRRQRELREITLREIADSSKISLRYLEALEGDRFDVLPASVFARGFLREYAKYVGLNADEVVNHYLYAQQSLEPEAPAPGKAPPRRAASSLTYVLLFVAALVALVGVVSFSAFWAERERSQAAPPTVIAPPVAAPMVIAPPVEAPPVVEPEPSAPLRVELDFTGECWFEARVDGQRPRAETRIQGETLRLDAQEKVVLTLGNATTVRIAVNGHPLEVPLPAGQVVVHDLLIDLATAARLGGTVPPSAAGTPPPATIPTAPAAPPAPPTTRPLP
jgi:cytoskeletal protein RodZ